VRVSARGPEGRLGSSDRTVQVVLPKPKPEKKPKPKRKKEPELERRGEVAGERSGLG
jgi:hypothetical protein